MNNYNPNAMKLKEITKKHDIDSIVRSAIEVKRHISGCVTEEQRETAQDYVSSWREHILRQEKLDTYKGFTKIVCEILGIDEHKKCINQIDSIYDILITAINNDMQ